MSRIPPIAKQQMREEVVLEYLLQHQPASAQTVRDGLEKRGLPLSLVTVRRVLRKLVAEHVLDVEGGGRSTEYFVSLRGRLLSPVDANQYTAVEPDVRDGARSFSFDLFPALRFDPFSDDEKKAMDEATARYQARVRDLSPALHKKELERFVIELSWKSSKVEGNTYTLLDTERLLLHGTPAPGHSKEEAQMILNHKEAFALIYENKESFRELTRANLEEIHKRIVKGLGVETKLRQKPVGVTGSTYRPLENVYQIEDGLDALLGAVRLMPDAYGKALVAILGVSYLQPFDDGNKRTARLAGNALLLAHGYAPLSYRSVDEETYREALLVFYELGALVPFKKLFVEQYLFAAENYLVA